MPIRKQIQITSALAEKAKAMPSHLALRRAPMRTCPNKILAKYASLSLFMSQN